MLDGKGKETPFMSQISICFVAALCSDGHGPTVLSKHLFQDRAFFNRVDSD